jgi:predicted XRE-type DNA-binding protein
MANIGKVIAFIVKYKIHQGMLAELLGIAQGTFSDKIRGLRKAKFTKEQQEKLSRFIKDLGVELESLTKND